MDLGNEPTKKWRKNEAGTGNNDCYWATKA